MSKIEIEVKLSDEDRSLLKSVKTALGGKTSTPKAAPKKAKEEEKDDEDFEDVDGDAEDAVEDEDDEDAEETEDEDDGDDDKPTRANVRDALRELADKSSHAAAIKLMKTVSGSDKLSTVKEGKFAAVIAAAEKQTAALAKKKKPK
jgi:hypothetical protein